MKVGKYKRKIKLLCPTCGCSDFSYDEEPDESEGIMVCVSCEREFNKRELIRENSENINMNISEMKNEVLKDAADEIRKSLKKAFSGSKNIRLK